MIIREQEVEILCSHLIPLGESGMSRFSYAEGERLIELAGRICYKSEDRITSDSWKEFLQRRKAEGHTSIFEHHWQIRKFESVSKVLRIGSPFLFQEGEYISGNVLAFERDFPEYDRHTVLVSAEEIKNVIRKDVSRFAKLIPISARFVTNRGITHEMVRHRYPFSYSQESTRYCRYAERRESGNMVFIRPHWLFSAPIGVAINPSNVNGVLSQFCGRGVTEANQEKVHKSIGAWLYGCFSSEASYKRMLEMGRTPQEARGVLTNDLKTEIIVTTSVWGWNWVLWRRLDPAAHPQYRELMEEFVRRCSPFITL